MKKYILLAAFVAAGVISVSQTQDVMTVKMKDGTSHEFKVEDVSEVTFGSSEINPHYPVAEAIDLGLPSGTKWASWNVGASAPEEYGGYYAWGETEEKEVYDWSTYKYCNGSWDTMMKYCSLDFFGYNGFTDDLTELLPEDDAATANWGAPWHMPSLDQIKELIYYCTRTWTQLNGVDGSLVTGPNGNTIFLPAAGGRWEDILGGEGENGHYWSSSLYDRAPNATYELKFNSGGWYWNDNFPGRCNGFTVRAVISPEKPQDTFGCPDDHHPHIIDLGLPSGTKWSCCNIGSSEPEESGSYYAWGETEEKNVYDYYSYDETLIHLGNDIAGTEHDVAHVKWGGSWRMPSIDQFQELFGNCTTRIWTERNGVYGRLLTGPNGATIFLPAAGSRQGDDFYNDYSSGNYWSSSPIPGSASFSYSLNFTSDDWYWSEYPSYIGHSVRAVCP